MGVGHLREEEFSAFYQIVTLISVTKIQTLGRERLLDWVFHRNGGKYDPQKLARIN